MSENDSDMGLEHSVIQHLIGDIAEDILGYDGSQWSDFKPTPRKIKSVLNKQNKNKKKLGRQYKHSK
jgi:hypothetical protein